MTQTKRNPCKTSPLKDVPNTCVPGTRVSEVIKKKKEEIVATNLEKRNNLQDILTS